jgi:site-specific recombinase XerD
MGDAVPAGAALGAGLDAAAAVAFTPDQLLELCGAPRGRPPVRRHQWAPGMLDAEEDLLFPLVSVVVERMYPDADEEELHLMTCIYCKAYAPSTVASYVSKLRDFAAFCQARGLPGLPCTQEHVHLWLLHLAMRGSVAADSMPQFVSALNSLHRLLGLPPPVAEGDGQHKLFMQGLCRCLLPIRARTTKRPLQVQWLEAAIDVALSPPGGAPCPPAFLRDVVLCCVGFACGLRGSAVAAMHVQDIKLEGDVLRVHSRVSKARGVLAMHVADWEFYLAGHPRLRRLLQVFLLVRAMNAPGGAEAPLWCWDALGRPSTLTEARVDDVVRRVVARVAPEVDAESLSSHSMRVGVASALNALGVARDNIRLWVRWASPAMLDVYIRPMPCHAAVGAWFGWMVQRPPTLRGA